MPGESRVDLVIRAERAVVDDDGSPVERPAAIAVRDGRIARVLPLDAPVRAAAEVRFGAALAVLPGLVDTHVHLQDPGRDGWEGFDTGTAAAAAGGITTLVDMPLDSLPVTTSVAALRAKQHAAAGRTAVDVHFWGGAVPANLGRLGDLLDAGCVGVKAYLSDSGLAEFPPLTPAGLTRALTELAPRHGLLAVHAEDPEAIAAGAADTETPAVRTVIEAVRRTGGRAHVVHVSSADAADLIAGAQREGLAVSAETCPHYLSLTSEDGAQHADCHPPVRSAANRQRLWAHLSTGTLSCVVSDHSPSPGDVPGIAALQLSLPVVWTAARERGVPLADVVRWTARNPARLVGLGRKGRIAVGADADLCVLAPEEAFVVQPSMLRQRRGETPYTGRELFGAVRETWLRGVRLIPET